MGEVYEPLVWERLMAQAREGDVTVDVGAFIGLYTIALAKRVGPSGKVIAFEPNPQTFEELKRHVELNGIDHQVKLIPAAVSNHKGRVLFDVGKKSEARITEGVGVKTLWVEMVTLDEMFAHSKVDLLKIDVEGHEEKVLEGGKNLLQDPSRCPRAIYVEVHPYAWPALGTTSESLLGFLNRCSYRVSGMDEKPLKRIESWGEIFAYKEG
ncbi:MAG: FkbM family methyltransferase [Candidatus Omnitrophica bacterium]|nr:FkbM family methyltransferase [Candidatus Omnitrophota bacterium]